MINTWCSFISDNYDIIFVQATRDLRPDSLSWVDFVHLHNICNDKETKAEVSSRIFTTFVERNVKVITCIGNWQSFTAELKANRMFSSFVASKRSKLLSSDVFVVGILRKNVQSGCNDPTCFGIQNLTYIYESMMTDHWKPSGGKFKKLLTLEPISFWYFRLKEKMQIWRHDMLYNRNSIIHKFYHSHG